MTGDLIKRPFTSAARAVTHLIRRIGWLIRQTPWIEILETVGLAGLSMAAYMERPSAGVAVGSVSLLIIGYSLGD